MIVRQGGLSASPGSAVAKQGSLFDYFFICLEWKFIIHCCSDSDSDDEVNDYERQPKYNNN